MIVYNSDNIFSLRWYKMLLVYHLSSWNISDEMYTGIYIVIHYMHQDHNCKVMRTGTEFSKSSGDNKMFCCARPQLFYSHSSK